MPRLTARSSLTAVLCCGQEGELATGDSERGSCWQRGLGGCRRGDAEFLRSGDRWLHLELPLTCVCLCLQAGPGSTRSGVCSNCCRLQQNPLGWDAPGPDPTPCSSVQFVVFGVSSLCKGCSREQGRGAFRTVYSRHILEFCFSVSCGVFAVPPPVRCLPAAPQGAGVLSLPGDLKATCPIHQGRLRLIPSHCYSNVRLAEDASTLSRQQPQRNCFTCPQTATTQEQGGLTDTSLQLLGSEAQRS